MCVDKWLIISILLLKDLPQFSHGNTLAGKTWILWYCGCSARRWSPNILKLQVGFPQYLHWHLAEPSGLVELFLCLSSSIWNPNSSEQTSQVPPESSMVLQIFLCLSKFGLRVNVLVQYTHWNEQNSPNSKCLSNERSVLNCFLHVIQMNAELPCLVRLCCSKWSFLVKDWGQVGHWNICLEFSSCVFSIGILK